MGQFSKVEAQIPALMVESVFYGVYLITFFTCLQRLLWDSSIGWKPLRRRTNVSMLFIILLLFACSSMSLSLTFVRNMNLFIYSPRPDKGIGIGQPEQTPLNVLKPVTLAFQTIIADCVLIYRCWLVWNKSLLAVCLPIICWLGSVTCGIIILYYRILVQLGSGRHDPAPVSVAFWASTILVNIFSSCLILWRLWKVERSWSPPSICSIGDIPQRNRLQFARRSLIESGLIYTSMTIIVFLTNVCGSEAIYVTNAAEAQIIGIAFNLIIMRAAGSYPDRMDSVPVFRTTDFTLSERLENRTTVDVAVMTTEDCILPCNQPIALPHV